MKRNKKGFTLAELLIVVAIIAVLVAVSIPVFRAQLEKSQHGTALANARSAYAEMASDYLMDTAANQAANYPKDLNAFITAKGYEMYSATVTVSGSACTVTLGSHEGTFQVDAGIAQ